MATNPPITIGELTDVPAPGSGVKSAWHQEITNRIPHRFATVAARDTQWPAATAGPGALCITRDTGKVWQVIGGLWVQMWPTPLLAGTGPGGNIAAGAQATVASIAAVPAGEYLVNYTVMMLSTAVLTGTVKLFVAGTQVFNTAFTGLASPASVQLTSKITVAAAAAVTVNIANGGTQRLDTFADPSNHQITALKVAT